MRMRTIDNDIDDEENYQGMKGGDDCGDDTRDEMHQDIMKFMIRRMIVIMNITIE